MSKANTVFPTLGASKALRGRLAELHFIRDRRWSGAQKRALITVFGEPEVVYAQSEPALKEIIGGRWRNHTAEVTSEQLDADINWLEQSDHYLITDADGLPNRLRELPDPPLALFAIGNVDLLNDPMVAMVGSRHPTPAGRRMTEQIASGLAQAGVSVVSGMALGIDGVAHQAVLDVGGSTVAVMGCGLDTIYPARHRGLFEEIANQGCILSEYPLGVSVSRYTFPQRNRLVSGLSLGSVIIEAAERSGTLITARLAMEQNRSVMVVPGSPLSRQYKGSHELIQQGACLVTSAEEVMRELELPLRQALQVSSAEPVEGEGADILRYVFHESTTVDEIIQSSGLTAGEVSSMLLVLEVQGKVAQADDGGYVKLVD